jgi:hypothetical protein
MRKYPWLAEFPLIMEGFVNPGEPVHSNFSGPRRKFLLNFSGARYAYNVTRGHFSSDVMTPPLNPHNVNGFSGSGTAYRVARTIIRPKDAFNLPNL